MSENNSARDNQDQSSEQVGDQSAHLDSLIAQFEGDCDIDMATKADMAIDAEKSELDESAAQSTAAIEAAAESEPIERNDSSMIVLLVSIVAIALLGSAIWKDFAGGEEKIAVIDQSLTNTTPARIGARIGAQIDAQTDAQPVAVTIKDQQASLPVLKTSEEKELQATEAEQVTAAVVKQQEPEMQTETIAPPASKEVQAVKPVAPKVVTAKARKISWAVNLTSVSTLASAEKIQQGLKNRGITSEVKQATIGGKSYYRIRIGGFGSKQEAEQVRLPLLKEREFSSAWLERYREEAQLAE